MLMLPSPYTEHSLTIVTVNIMYGIKHNQAMIIAMTNKQPKTLKNPMAEAPK